MLLRLPCLVPVEVDRGNSHIFFPYELNVTMLYTDYMLFFRLLLGPICARCCDTDVSRRCTLYMPRNICLDFS